MRRSRTSVLVLGLALPALAACGGSGGGGGGGGPPSAVVVHVATSGTIAGDATRLSHPWLNGDPDARLMVTHVINPGGGSVTVQNRDPIGVRYVGVFGQWEIFNLNGAPMEPDASFFVTVLEDTESIVHTALPGNIAAHQTEISSAGGDPAAVLFVTQFAGAPDSPGYTVNPHNVGVYFTGAAWRIFNQDFAPMPEGARFFVAVDPPSGDAYTHVTTAPSVGGSLSQWTYLDHAMLNDNPEAVFHVTAHWDPPGPGHGYNDHPLGVVYNYFLGRWAIVNVDDGEMLVDRAFNVWIQ
jgi:hypothetical protein